MATRSLSTSRRPVAAAARAPAGSRRAWRAHDRAIVRAGRTLVERGLVVGTVGNVSARIGDRVRITPTRTAYAGMRRRDLVSVDLASGAAGPANASRELPLHLSVYRARPDVGAVIHTHSVAATAWSFLDEPLEPELEDLAYYGVGAVRIAAPAPPGSAELATNVTAALGSSNAVLLGHHGVLTVGASVPEALVIAEVIEHQARIAWTLRGRAA